MARSGKTAQEFIQNSFSPILAVLCSPKVDNIVCKNNLTFPELLQPFTTVDWEGQFREPGGSVCTIKNWKLVVRDVNWKPLQPTEARKQLNNAVLYNYSDKTVSIDIEGKKIDIPQSTPWFDAWRETYLEVQFPSDHEFTKHFVSCIIVGTTLDDNIVDTFNSLNQQYAQLQNVTPPKLPKWFNSGVLKSYLLLHDVSCVMKEKADAMFESLKQNFGATNCFMLSINSKSALEPSLTTDYWTPYIKRTSDSNTEMSASALSHASSPLEPPPSAVLVSGTDELNTLTISTNADAMHPLTTNENDVYDNANSLQTHSFSGSSESMNVAGRLLDYSTEVHGVALNNSDVDAIKQFIHDYASKSLLPYLEKQIAQLSELVANKKGVSRSLLSATKRWFGTGKGGNTTGGNTVIYSNDCPELQLRRLGDLWFLCGQWQRAFDTYHTAKREFYADSAWLCYAGALEMAAISAFMAGESNRKTHGYMEESIVTYLNTCRMVQYAVRATLLSVLCLGSSGLHGEAAKQLIRMTAEDSDLRSAMLLEQAALCFLSGPGTRAMCRKYAFHMVLAGHRFSKAGQKKHAYRCYNQAYQVYTESGWRLATDHVQFALGRLASTLKLTGPAVHWLGAPLAPASLQPPRQQEAFLREYMMAHQQWIESSDEFKDRLPILPLPLLDKHSTAVLCVGPAPLSSPGRQPATSLSLSDADRSEEDSQYWHKMEEMLLQVAQGSVPMIFKPTVDLYTEKSDGNPSVPQGEPIQISVMIENPLKVPLTLKDVELLWQFTTTDEDTPEIPVVINNEPIVATGSVADSNVIYGEKTKFVILEPDVKKILTFSLTPHKVGALVIQSLAYKLSYTGENGQEKAGAMISGKLDLSTGVEKRLHIAVVPHAPCLQMTFSETSPEAISGEIRTLDVEFRNVGPVDMRNVHVAVSRPDCVSLVTAARSDDPFSQLYADKYKDQVLYSDERTARTMARIETAQRHAHKAWDHIGRGECARATLLLRPRVVAPQLYLLAYYEPGDRPAAYRLLRHVFRFQLNEAISIGVTPRRGLSTRGDKILENLNLVLEVKNVCNEKDDSTTLHLLESSLLSKQWELTDLIASRNKDEPLMSREKQHFILKAKRIKENVQNGQVSWSCKKISESHPEAKDNINVLPYAKFVTDYKTYNENGDSPINVERPKAGLIQSNIVVRWKIQDKNKRKTAVGQSCLWLECFTDSIPREKEILPEGSLPLQLEENEFKSDLGDSKKKQEDNVVMFRMEHSNQINHDFKARKLCLVPITMNIVNCHGVPVTVFVNMTKQDNRESLNVLGWTGALSGGGGDDGKEVGVAVNLSGFEARSVGVKAVCAAPGAYLLGEAFSVTARVQGDSVPVTHPANNSSLLVVQQA